MLVYLDDGMTVIEALGRQANTLIRVDYSNDQGFPYLPELEIKRNNPKTPKPSCTPSPAVNLGLTSSSSAL
jgi:hypothetical protein